MRKSLLMTTMLVWASVGAQAQDATSPNPTPIGHAAPMQDSTPGNGSATDCDGHVWTVNSENRIEEDGDLVMGGGDTSQLIIAGCTIYGKSNGENGSSTNWFTMGSDSPTVVDGWAVSETAPPGATTTSISTGNIPLAAPVTPGAIPAATPVTTPPVVTPPGNTSSCAASGTGTGVFRVEGGQIIGPDGQPFVARGIAVADSDAGQVDQILQVYPGLNYVRLAVYDLGEGPDQFTGFINAMTSHGTVVVIDDHANFPSPAFSGGMLAAEASFFASYATAYAGNPLVWFSSQNEPQSGDISAEHGAVYQAIRNTGNNNPIVFDLLGGGNPGTLGVGGALNAGAYAGMTNIIWDLHFYDWAMGYSSDQATIANALANEVQQQQTITSADGIVPVIIGEYGNSTSGSGIDAGGEALVQAVISAGPQNGIGSAAWIWENPYVSDGSDSLTHGGQLTEPYGQAVALFVNTDVKPLTACELTAAAQQGIADATTALTAATAQ